MDIRTNNYSLHVLVLFSLPVIIFTQLTCPLTYRCRNGYRCAMVRHGSGPPVPDCITIEEAMLLEQAYLGGATGPGTGIMKQIHYPRFRRRRLRRPGAVLHPGLGIFGLGGVNHGVPGVIPLSDGGHVHVPHSVRDQSERINLNLTIHNENNNKHDQRGSGNVQVSQVAGPGCTPCGPEGLCPPPQHCMWTNACPNNLGCRLLP